VWVIAGLMAVAWLCGRAAAQLESDERSSLGLGVLWCIPLLAFVAWFRPYAAGLAVVGLIGGGLLAHFVLRGRRPSLGALALTVLGSLVVFFVLVSLTREPLHDVFGRDALHYRESRYLVGGSNIGLRYNENILHDTVVYLYSFFSNAFGPLPWQIDKPVMLVPMLLELPAFIVIVIVLVRGRHAWPSPVTLWCSMALVWLAALGVWNDNLGAALRLRAPAWILLAVSAVCVHFTARGAREGVQAASTDALSRG